MLKVKDTSNFCTEISKKKG